MGKRVYELAKELGMENKDLIEKLKSTGIEVSSHSSSLSPEDLAKFEAATNPVEPTPQEVVEKVVKPGLIRRRKKAVETPVEVAPEPVAEAPAPVEVVEEPTPSEEPVEPATVELAPEPVEALVAEKPETASEPVEAPVQETSTPQEEAAPAEATPKDEPAPQPVQKTQPAPEKVKTEAVPAKPAEPQAKSAEPAKVEQGKATASRAKILGRVELPTMKKQSEGDGRRQERPRRRPEGGDARKERPARPARPGRPGRPGGNVAAVAPPPEPPSEDKKRGKKKKKGGRPDEGMEDGRGGKHTKVSRRGKAVDLFEPEHSPRMRKPKKKGQKAQPAKQEAVITKAIKRLIRISDTITVGELAKRMGIKANELIAELMRQGSMVTINHPLDFDTASILASEYNYEVENVAFDEDTILEATDEKLVASEEEEVEGNLEERPPVVTIMGHVDHGKTSLLDAIREARVTEGEAGGITQHIGAYDVELHGKKITFLDTPGHEAFTAMRARGAQVTDIVILVVAADDGVMPQTKEAINHSKAAGVPMIVAVNKIDKPEANPDRVKQELTEFEMVPEEWGGDTIFCEVSAKAHTNLDQLLEMVLLQAEVLELKAVADKRAKGTIVESRLDKGRGPVATVLVQEGTLKVGDAVVSGLHSGRVRSMIDDRGNPVEEAGPSFPVEVTGLAGVPNAGEMLHAVENEKQAKEVAQHRQHKQREAELAKSSKVSLDQLFAKIQEGEFQELKVIVKADVQGSIEAIRDSLEKLSTDQVRLSVIHTAVGGINESDVTLAAASDAFILGFNVRPEAKASTMADSEGVDLRLYSVIYDAVNDVRDAMSGLLAPTFREQHLGRAEVRETFSVSRVGTIAGCYVLDGKMVRNAEIRLVRDNVVIYEGKLNSLKRFKDDAKEVATGYECGMGLENYNDIKIGDIIEAYTMEEVQQSL